MIFLTVGNSSYDGFNYHLNVLEGLKFHSDYRIKVGKEEYGTINYDQVYNALQENQNNKVTK